MNLTPFVLDAARGALILGVALAALPVARRASASIRRALLLTALVAALVSPLASRAFAATRAAQAVALPFFVREIHFDPAVEPTGAPPAVDGGDRSAAEERIVRTHARMPVLTWSTLLLFVWALGAAGVVARLGLGVQRARSL